MVSRLQLFVLAAGLVLSACAKRPVTTGSASWYGPGFRGNPTASGERFRPARLTAAHRTLPFGTVLKVRHDGRVVRVVINDRGPYHGSRILDLSKGAARRLGMLKKGVADVELQVIGCRTARFDSRRACRHQDWRSLRP